MLQILAEYSGACCNVGQTEVIDLRKIWRCDVAMMVDIERYVAYNNTAVPLEIVTAVDQHSLVTEYRVHLYH